jgi:hypothetical protein
LAMSNAIQNGVLPKPSSVSLDQMVNYFEYDFPAPKDEESMSISVEAIPCPWSPESQLVQVGLIGRETAEDETGNVEIATDVDVQVQFDPAKVKSYRLLGYENRGTGAVAEANDADKTFATSETTTALYEVVPHEDTKADDSLLTVHLNYNDTDGSREMAASLAFSKDKLWSDATADLRFASAVAGFGLFLREDEQVEKSLSLSRLKAMASNATDSRDKKRRQLFVALINKTQKLKM